MSDKTRVKSSLPGCNSGVNLIEAIRELAVNLSSVKRLWNH